MQNDKKGKEGDHFRLIKSREAWLEAHNESLQAALTNRSISLALQPFVDLVSSDENDLVRSSFYVTSVNGRQDFVVGNMPMEYNVQATMSGSDNDHVLNNMHRRGKETIIICDVKNDPASTRLHSIAMKFDFCGYWSFPVSINDDTILGYFSIFFQKPRRPNQSELNDIKILTDTAAFVISHYHEKVDLYHPASAIQGRETKYQDLFNTINEGFCLIEMLYDDQGRAIDYRYLEVNKAFEKLTGLESANGKTMRELQPKREPIWLDIYSTVALTHDPVHFVNIAENFNNSVWYDVSVFPHSCEDNRYLALHLSDVTDRIVAEEKLRSSEHRFRTFVAASASLVYRMSPDWQEMYTLTGKHFLKDTLNPDRNWVDTYIPIRQRQAVWSKINKAIKSKQTFEFEHQVIRADNSVGWVHSRAIPILNEKQEIREWLGAASDITAQKDHEEQTKKFQDVLEETVAKRTQELKESRDQLRSLLDTSLVQMSILKAVRCQENRITDFRIVLANRELQRETGRKDLQGKLYAKEFPGIVGAGIFDLIVTTIKTGKPQSMEYFYPHENFNKWFSCMFVKFEDGVVATNIDITARKLAEAEHVKNYLLLKQSEELALLGSWHFEIETKEHTWSDGMYQLFNMVKGTPIQPEVYLKFATKKGLPSAKKVVEGIYAGSTDLEEEIEIKVGHDIKTLRLRAIVVRDTTQKPIRILGVDKDISAKKASDEQIRKLEVEQRLEVFRVSLETLEEERHRIAESLHNGIGQVLYGLKINLSSLALDMSKEEFNKTTEYINNLLTDAIKETRRVSHELMPIMLEDFGLRSAIDDICKQLSDGIQFDCHVIGFHDQLEKYLELAVFRTVQELMTNVFKHARATQATVIVDIGKKDINISVSDNGKGIALNSNKKPGIGLAAIRSKIKLLYGRMNIDSKPDGGTKVSITFPRPKQLRL